MEKPKYTLKFREEMEIPKNEPKVESNQWGWKIFFIITVLLVALDLLAYGGIHSFGATIGLLVLYIRFTFPKTRTFIRVVIWFVASLFIAFALIVNENDLLLFFAVPLYLWSYFSKKLERVLLPVEIQFYDDYLIIYREKATVSIEPRYVVKEYNKIFYDDVKVVEFGQIRKSILKFHGKVEVLRYKYNEDGTLNEEPLLHRVMEHEYTNINTKESPEVDFVQKIERYSPLKVKRNYL